MTQFILQLIEIDKQQNSELFQKLEQIENMKRELKLYNNTKEGRNIYDKTRATETNK